MPAEPNSALEPLLGSVDANTRQALRANEAAILAHAAEDEIAFLGRATASDGSNVDRGAFVYLTGRVMGIAVDGEVVSGFPSKHITGVRAGTESSGGFPVLVEARPVNRSFEFVFDDSATQRRFLDSVA
jgi:hypothetical protein